MNFNNFIKNDFTKVNKVEESLFTAMFISASIYFTLKHFWTELSNRSILNDLNKNVHLLF
jgi:cell division protein FtsL